MAKDEVSPAARIAVIGGSAGSIEVLLKLLPKLPPAGGAPALVIVIHRPSESDSDMARMLAARCAWPLREAEDKTLAEAGHAYLAPADYHLLIERDGRLSLDYSEKLHYCRPAIDVTMESAAESFGADTRGLLLSGANRDGAVGLQHIFAAGGAAAVQEPVTAVARFMPEAALALERGLLRLRIEEMVEFLAG